MYLPQHSLLETVALYRSLNAIVAQSKKFAFGINNSIELKNFKTTPYNTFTVLSQNIHS
jgi:hypothetical protein